MPTLIIKEQDPNIFDHDLAYIDDKYVGFVGHNDDDRSIALLRCPRCGRENYCMAVLSGQCCWCGYDVNVEIGGENERND